MLKISKPGFRCDPGQYVLVKVRPLSAFVEWHPFSVSSYEGEHGPGMLLQCVPCPQHVGGPGNEKRPPDQEVCKGSESSPSIPGAR